MGNYYKYLPLHYNIKFSQFDWYFRNEQSEEGDMLCMSILIAFYINAKLLKYLHSWSIFKQKSWIRLFFKCLDNHVLFISNTNAPITPFRTVSSYMIAVQPLCSRQNINLSHKNKRLIISVYARSIYLVI